ncbi:MAG: hypothetical protein ACYSR8_12315 [Planctomycetota bacterium]|jgi:hypothetical protein
MAVNINSIKPEADNMTEHQQQEQTGGITPEVLKSAFKAFKKRLKLTARDDDSRLGRGALSGGPTGVFAIRPPSQFQQEVCGQLCRRVYSSTFNFLFSIPVAGYVREQEGRWTYLVLASLTFTV